MNTSLETPNRMGQSKQWKAKRLVYIKYKRCRNIDCGIKYRLFYRSDIIALPHQYYIVMEPLENNTLYKQDILSCLFQNHYHHVSLCWCDEQLNKLTTYASFTTNFIRYYLRKTIKYKIRLGMNCSKLQEITKFTINSNLYYVISNLSKNGYSYRLDYRINMELCLIS